MNCLVLLLLLCGCNNNGNGNFNGNFNIDNCGCEDDCGRINILNTGCGNPSSDCGCGMDAFDGRIMEPRMEPRMDARMDTRPFMPFQGGTCGCEDNSPRQNNNNCGIN